MDGLFAKIDAISVPPQQTNIPKASRLTLEALHNTYKVQEAELLATEAALRAIPSTIPTIQHELKRLTNDTARYREDARPAHIRRLIKHFATTYHLDLDGYPTDIRELEQHPDDDLIDVVCAWVLKVLGGKTFEQLAEEQLLDGIRARLSRAKHDRRNLTFPYATSETEITLLANAAHHFQTPGSRASQELLNALERYASNYYTRAPGKAIPLELERVISFTPYKNHNVKVTFATEADARAFMATFGIEHDPA